MEPICYVTNHRDIFDEAKAILNKLGISISHYKKEFKEIQTKSIDEYMKNKVIAAFDKIRRPLIVEYTGLYFKKYKTPNFPGILTHTIFDLMGPKLFAKTFMNEKATAKTIIGYTDGKRIKILNDIPGVRGTITPRPKGGNREWWDCVFMPNRYNKTFAEMNGEKNKISMRKKALTVFVKYFNNNKPKPVSEPYNNNFRHLCDDIEDNNIVLFIGAGVSKNLGLPDFNELIGQLRVGSDFKENEIFKLYGENRELAEYYAINKSAQVGKENLSGLATWMAENWNVKDEKIKKSEIHKLIIDLDCKIIYTTNYDRILERAYILRGQNPKIIKSIVDMKGIEDDRTQIIKFHGDYSEPSSMVLTESKYFKRMDFEDPLDIRFRSDILHKSILFLGYSLNDINLRYLFYKLNEIWKKDEYKEAIKNKSYIFLQKPNPVQKLILDNRSILTILSNKSDPKEGLIDLLKAIKTNTCN